ncbi:hypothetical protein GCM10009122_23300 [Fulvivirga kasyanovii]|uniref:Uncharacterized protein n=1 Tax=Fulvivirga kasyanovii TaxID=396812 RepID=A0ABW9RXH4_9BACT|nr:hypothetical protein [Fulvivirga kasyanovii]MTI28964.1 hypothetical protein [Fulvivirga kasyanovii]
MKKLSILFGISVFAGAGYLVWAYTPLGKKVLSQWLTRKWLESAGQEGIKLDKMKMDSAMYKLTYQDLELLARYTWLGIMDKYRTGTLDAHTRQKGLKLYKKMEESGTFKRSDVRELHNVVFPAVT